jgi:hypothetical protein
LESINNNVYLNEQLIFSDIYFQATNKETKNLFLKKEKNIFFNYEQENVIKYVCDHFIGKEKNTNIFSLSIKNNSSSPNNLYDINFYRNIEKNNFFDTIFLLREEIEYYINDVLIDAETSQTSNVFKQINLSKDENIVFSTKDKSLIQFLWSIKIENI